MLFFPFWCYSLLGLLGIFYGLYLGSSFLRKESGTSYRSKLATVIVVLTLSSLIVVLSVAESMRYLLYLSIITWIVMIFIWTDKKIKGIQNFISFVLLLLASALLIYIRFHS